MEDSFAPLPVGTALRAAINNRMQLDIVNGTAPPSAGYSLFAFAWDMILRYAAEKLL
jgi:hypothetical protein